MQILLLCGAMVWIFVYPWNSYIEILTPSVDSIGGRDLGNWWGHEDGILLNEISAL